MQQISSKPPIGGSLPPATALGFSKTEYRQENLGVYIATVVVVFFCTLSAADSIGFVPYYIDGSSQATALGFSKTEYRQENLGGTEPTVSAEVVDNSVVDTSAPAHILALASLPELGADGSGATTPTTEVPERKVESSLPKRIQIPAIGLDLPVQNPTTLDVTALDALLQKGPARYAQSAKLGEKGNVIIFGHSSHLPVVHNQMYRAFNKIPEVKAGDIITVSGENDTDYLYSVVSVESTDTSDVIPLDTDAERLTIVTCDTLTGKSARFVLDASFVGTAKRK